MIDMRPDHLEIVKDILKRHAPDTQVRAFGSRVSRTAKAWSDLDLVIVGDEKLDFRILARIKGDLEESDLPFRVDVLDWQRVSESFRKLIEEKYAIIQEPMPSGHA